MLWWETKWETEQKEWKKGTIKTMTAWLMPVVSCEILTATSLKVSFIKNSPSHVSHLFNKLDAIFRLMNPLAPQRHFLWLTRTMLLFCFKQNKTTKNVLLLRLSQWKKNERKCTLMSPAGLAFERKRCQYCQLSFRPQTQNSSFHHNVSLSLLFYSIPLLCLCHWTRILSARLSYLHQKCRSLQKGKVGGGCEGWGGGGARGEELCWGFSLM